MVKKKFLERWLRDVVEPNTAHRTYAAHRQQVRSHIIPSLERVKLEALRKHHIDRFYADLLRPKSAGGDGLAPSSARHVHAVLHAAMEEAVGGDLIPRNPGRHANKPKVRTAAIEGKVPIRGDSLSPPARQTHSTPHLPLPKAAPGRGAAGSRP